MVLDPERALLVRETFRLYATGEYSLPELQATMHAKGLTSPYARRPGAPVSVSKLAELLTNPFYVGVVQWGGARYEGQHKALIPQSLFDRVQETLRARDVAGTRQRRHEHYLKGLLHCGECGRRLSLTLAKGRYLYFYCLGQRGSARTGCRQPYVLAGDAEALVEDLYRQIQLPRSWVSRLTEELEAEIVERQAEASERRVRLTKTLAKLAEERGKLLQAFYANAIPLDLLKAEQDRIGAAEQAGQGRARDDGGRPRRLAGRPSNGHPTRRQLPRGVPEGAAVGAATLQRRGAPGRLHQGPEDRSNGVLGGLRASLLSPEFE